MDINNLQHKMIFGKNRMIYVYAFLGLTAATVVGGIFNPNLIIILGACAFTALLLFIIDISNVKRFGRYYAIDIIDNQIIEMSEKGGTNVVRPEDILEIVQPKDLNLVGPGKANHNERYFYIKLNNGKTLGVSGMVSDYDGLVNKVKDYALQNNLKEKTKITGIF